MKLGIFLPYALIILIIHAHFAPVEELKQDPCEKWGGNKKCEEEGKICKSSSVYSHYCVAEEEPEAEEAKAEDELEAEEKEIETDLDKARILNEGITADYQEDELTEFMVDELGDLLELDEDEVSDEMEQDYSPASEITYALEEDVFDSWDEAEEAFMGFDKDTAMSEDVAWTDAETGTEKNSGRDYFSYEEGRYGFNEDELKDIATNSVQNALEKSIASSLVELAVSEIKNNVSGRV
jgi:hypothetical protein